MAGFLDFLDDPLKREQLGAFGFGLLQATAPSTDPSARSLGAGIGAGGQAMLQMAAKQRAEARENRRLGMEEDAILAKQHEALRKQGMAAQMGAWWNEGSPKGPQTPDLMSKSYRTLGDRLMTSGNVEGAKQAYDLAKQYQEKYQAPITAMQGGKPVLVQPGDQGGVRPVAGYEPKPEFKSESLGDRARIFNALDPANKAQWQDWMFGVNPSTKYQADNPPMSILPTDTGYMGVNTRGTPMGVPVMPAAGIPTAPISAPGMPARGALPVTDTGAVAPRNELPIQYKQKKEAIVNMGSAVGNLRETLKTLGPDAFVPGTEANRTAGTIFTDLQMQAKGVFELGAITGPDMKVLDGFVSDPRGAISTISRAVAGDKAAQAQLDQIDKILERNLNTLDRVHKPYLKTQSPPAPGAGFGDAEKERRYQEWKRKQGGG